jgi:hypothetical protein
MPDPLPTTPEVAPVVPTPAPELDFSDIAERGVEQWLYDAMGGDKPWLDYVAAHPDKVQDAATLFGKEKVEIETEGALKLLNITYRIGLLIYAEFKSMGEKPAKSTEAGAAETSLQEQLKGKSKDMTFDAYKSYWKAKPALGAPLFPDEKAHSIWTGEELFKGLTMATDMNTKGKDMLEEWPERFPYPAGSRVVLDRSDADIQTDITSSASKLYFDSVGLKIVPIVLTPGTRPSAPAADEIQVVSLQDPATMTWDAVKEAQKLWDDTVPTQFQGAPKTLAAIQALEEKGPVYSSPEDICKKVGILTPDQSLLDFLKTIAR